MQKFFEGIAILIVVGLIVWILYVFGSHWFFPGT